MGPPIGSRWVALTAWEARTALFPQGTIFNQTYGGQWFTVRNRQDESHWLCYNSFNRDLSTHIDWFDPKFMKRVA